MRTLGTFTLTMILGMPSLSVAEDQGILASAKRLAAAEGAAQQIEVGGTRRSATAWPLGWPSLEPGRRCCSLIRSSRCNQAWSPRDDDPRVF